MLRDLGNNIGIGINVDASAAQGIAARRGLGKVRHIEVQQLWVQDKVHKGEIVISKTNGKGNLADALTKPVGKEDLELHVDGMGIKMEIGRHDLAPELNK